MLITRRTLLSWVAAASPSAFCPRMTVAAENGALALRRVSDIIRAYEQQGFHRTGTAIDHKSGDWLCQNVRHAGLTPTRESFSLSRIDPITNVLIADGRRIVGMPLFDGAFTDEHGIQGHLGALGSDAEIGVAETVPNAAASGSLGDARRKNHHKAIVCVTRGAKPGLCPSNANSFPQPFGPPVLQVSSDDASWLTELASRGAEVQLIAHVNRTAATAVNVTATIKGADVTLPPLVISTPRSGWYSCASERGGGIVCWLEAMRALRVMSPARTVIFAAFSGHELGYLGIHAFGDRRPDILSNAAAWIHFGANIGAATDPRNRLVASDDDFEEVAGRAMASVGLSIDERAPRGTMPGGEAEVVHHAGRRYVAVTGRSALFHNPEDRGAQAVDPSTIMKFSTAFIAVATPLAAR
jgi:hypothetical protein